MWKKQRIIKNVKIEKIWFWWIWISHTEYWKTILISWWVLPNTIVDIKILKNTKDFIKAQVIKIHKDFLKFKLQTVIEQLISWKQIIEVNNTKVCKHNYIFDTDAFNFSNNKIKNSGCGGCKWQILPYEQQLKLKKQVVEDTFSWKQFFSNSYEWIIWCNKIFNYRNKMEFSFWYNENKEICLWFHKQWQFSKIVNIKSCLIAWEKINKIFKYLKKIILNSWLMVYNNIDHSWFFRHLVIREWFNTWQVLVNLVVASDYFKKHLNEINKWKKLQETFMQDNFLKENVTTFIITENNDLADIVKWKNIKSFPLWGGWYIFERLIIDNYEINFRVSSFSFFQTNTYQAQILFKLIKDFLNKEKWTILDLYCWTWSIWISLLKMWIWNKLIWIEIVEDAIKDAYKNAEINWILQKCKFLVWKSENIDFDYSSIWTIIVDPPRSWLHKNLIKFLLKIKSKNNLKLIYVSCNPVTMARDMENLIDWWYKLKKIKAVDMFPHTHHIEMVWLLC